MQWPGGLIRSIGCRSAVPGWPTKPYDDKKWQPARTGCPFDF